MKIRLVLLIVSIMMTLCTSSAWGAIYMGTGAAPNQPTQEVQTAYPSGLVPQQQTQHQVQVNCQFGDAKGVPASPDCFPVAGGYDSAGIMLSYPVKSGSLKENVENIVNQSHWGKVVWTLPFDYNWIGDMDIRASSVQQALAQLLKKYPVQAVFYDKNHVVAIVARRSK